MVHLQCTYTSLIATIWMSPLPPSQESLIYSPPPSPPLPLWYFLYSNNGIDFFFFPFWCVLDWLFVLDNEIWVFTITGHLQHCKMNCIKWLHCAIFSQNEIQINIYQNVFWEVSGEFLTAGTVDGRRDSSPNWSCEASRSPPGGWLRYRL